YPNRRSAETTNCPLSAKPVGAVAAAVAASAAGAPGVSRFCACAPAAHDTTTRLSRPCNIRFALLVIFFGSFLGRVRAGRQDKPSPKGELSQQFSTGGARDEARGGI